jgi:hypothetical protein
MLMIGTRVTLLDFVQLRWSLNFQKNITQQSKQVTILGSQTCLYLQKS